MIYFDVVSCNMHENPGKNTSVDTFGAQGIPTLCFCIVSWPSFFDCLGAFVIELGPISSFFSLTGTVGRLGTLVKRLRQILLLFQS